MGITVREALQLGGLKEARVVAGEKGLGRVIKYVLTMDVPDAAKWIKGGELLLSAAYVFANKPEMEENFVRDLVEKGTAALGVKPGRFINTIPPSIINEANENDFPIIEIPIHVSWHDIVNPVLTEIINKETTQLKRSKLIHDELMTVLLHGGGLDSIAKSLASLLNCMVFIEDESFNILTYFTNHGPCDELSNEILKVKAVPLKVIKELKDRKILNELKMYKKPYKVHIKSIPNSFPRVMVPIVIDDEVYGYICLVENNSKITEHDIIATEQASTIAALEFFKQQTIKEAEGKAKRDFLDNLVTGYVDNIGLIKSRLELYGICLKPKIAVILISMNYEDATEIEYSNFKRIEEAMDSENKNYVIFKKREKIIVIYSMGLDLDQRKRYDKINIIVKHILNQLKSYKKVKIGISDIIDTISDIPKGYQQAKRALEIDETVKNKFNGVIFYKDVWIYDVLTNKNSKLDLIKFCDDKVFKLMEWDLKSEENLLETLTVYLENMGKRKVTSEKLYIHRNTLNYRLNKIREILDWDLNDSSNRLRLEISLKIANILKK